MVLFTGGLQCTHKWSATNDDAGLSVYWIPTFYVVLVNMWIFKHLLRLGITTGKKEK